MSIPPDPVGLARKVGQNSNAPMSAVSENGRGTPALIGRGSKRGIPGINGRAAWQQRRRKRGTAVVREWPKLRVGVVQATDIGEGATEVGAKVVTTVGNRAGAISSWSIPAE